MMLLQKKIKATAIEVRSLDPRDLRPPLPATGNKQALKLAIITNHPPPFRIPVFERIAATPGIELLVIFCSRREPNRQWKVPPLTFNHLFLKERFVTRGDNFIHNNPDVLPALVKFGPDAVVTTGFNPTFLYAFAYCLASGVKHIPMTDGTEVSEQALSRWHKTLRRFIYSRSGSFIAASAGGERLYQSYGVEAERCFKSCLCIDNTSYLEADPESRAFDFIFCGRIVPGKNPLFALDVAAEAARRLQRRVSILFVGSGSQEEAVRRAAEQHAGLVDAHFNGFASQDELPGLYRSAKVFLFPTLADVWGVVANEACAAGLPIIVSPHAGTAGELILDQQNGFICDLDVGAWSERAVQLLTDDDLWQGFSERSREIVSGYSFDHAAAGVVAAATQAVRHPRKARARIVASKAGLS
ncbi:Glycosyltransferase involved in cell wall bisynthesis [Noviherbaspirillum humi]|uniref:Glycosyltransferase involved in cell wall bisynthesis n=1 Tax=Noviherbaspirillum humi TaxID=1688639 RepID=A0A239GYL5_9BURK|nr:glycosyltransferase [Noviherbaspirillum humi]SNS74306.1 Glycosyltransferase involved in cell wall bisynthesis [Noviherbaspirillum humi]